MINPQARISSNGLNNGGSFLELAKDLYEAIDGSHQVLALSRVGQQAAFAFLPTNYVFADLNGHLRFLNPGCILFFAVAIA